MMLTRQMRAQLGNRLFAPKAGVAPWFTVATSQRSLDDGHAGNATLLHQHRDHRSTEENGWLIR
jgi:hypothetical protein